jgi:hypothetical protein
MIARTWRLRKQAARASERAENGDLAGAEAEFTTALDADLPPRTRALAQLNAAYFARRQGKFQPAIAGLSEIARSFPELRLMVSSELAVCYALTGSGAAKVLLPEDGADPVAQGIVLARSRHWDRVEALRPARVLPWCEPLYRHERRLLPLIQTFADDQKGATVAVPNASRQAFAGEMAYLGASWPEMADFLRRTGLITAVLPGPPP